MRSVTAGQLNLHTVDRHNYSFNKSLYALIYLFIDTGIINVIITVAIIKANKFIIFNEILNFKKGVIMKTPIHNK